MKKKNVKIFFVSFLFILIIIISVKNFYEITPQDVKVDTPIIEDAPYNSNIIENVSYSSKDAKGNKYVVNALRGEIDFSDTNIVYLTDVEALIDLNNDTSIKITSEFGKHNTLNFDTIFSKNVIVEYVENKISGEYLDFSIKRNSLIISRDVVFTNLDNILKSDVIEINIKTKDTKIYMYENTSKVNIKNR